MYTVRISQDLTLGLPVGIANADPHQKTGLVDFLEVDKCHDAPLGFVLPSP